MKIYLNDEDDEKRHATRARARERREQPHKRTSRRHVPEKCARAHVSASE
jgi:hypothetical protein